MLLNVRFSETTLDEDGWDHYIYALTDSEFVTHFKVSDRHRYYIIPQLVKIYSSRKQPVASNIARYYLAAVPGTVGKKLVHVVEDDLHILEDYSKNYSKYHACVVQNVKNLLWSRRMLK